MDFLTADICDEFADEIAVLDTKFNSYGGVENFCGEIVTCKLQDNNQELIKILKSEGKGRVCVVDVDAKFVAVVGDKLMGFAKENNWSGLVINGYVRDTKTTKEIEVGLLALGVCPKKAPAPNEGKRGCELKFGGVSIKEGDYLYADCDGVIISKKRVV